MLSMFPGCGTCIYVLLGVRGRRGAWGSGRWKLVVTTTSTCDHAGPRRRLLSASAGIWCAACRIDVGGRARATGGGTWWRDVEEIVGGIGVVKCGGTYRLEAE